MPLLRKKYRPFDEKDVKSMQAMMKQFNDLHSGTGMPDFSNSYVGYLPVFTIALLASQESVARLSKVLIVLTIIIALLTLFLSWPTLLALF